eukprot:1781730-Lingulodinium_polyedra.AAC.1
MSSQCATSPRQLAENGMSWGLLGTPLERPWDVLGTSLGASLRRPWDVIGRPWASLARPWGILGASLA